MMAVTAMSCGAPMAQPRELKERGGHGVAHWAALLEHVTELTNFSFKFTST